MGIVFVTISNIVFLLVGYFLGKKVRSSQKAQKLETTAEKERREKIKKAFNFLMDYDYDKALGGGKYE